MLTEAHIRTLATWHTRKGRDKRSRKSLVKALMPEDDEDLALLVSGCGCDECCGWEVTVVRPKDGVILCDIAVSKDGSLLYSWA
jgi:hypothetical protein